MFEIQPFYCFQIFLFVIRLIFKVSLGIIHLVHTQNFPKKNRHFSPPDTHTCVCVSGGEKCFFFSENSTYVLNERSLLSKYLFKFNNKNIHSRHSRVHNRCSSGFFVDFEIVFSRRVSYVYPSIFRTLSNIYDGACENSEWLLTVNIYFCKKAPS